MPDVIGIGIGWNRPAQDNRVKAALVDEIRYKCRPFQNADFRLDADFRKLPLNDFRAFLPRFIALIRQDFKFKRFAVFLQHTVTVLIRKTRLFEQFARSGRVVSIGLYLVVIRPRTGFIRPRRGFAQAQQDPADDFIFFIA